MLRERLCSFMLEKHLDCYSPDYTTQKLKRRIANQCGTKIKFWTPNFKSELVYSANLPTGQAVESAFVAAASEKRRIEKAAYYILCYITYGRMTMQAYREAEECLCPPLTSFLLSEKAKPPEILISFMKILLAGKKSLRTKRENCFFHHSGYLLLCFKWLVEDGQASCPWYSCPTPHRKCRISEHAESFWTLYFAC